MTLAVLTVPSNALCLALKIDGTYTIERQFALTPGQGASFNLTGLPLGTVGFTGQVYGVACASITSMTSPTWSSDTHSTLISSTGSPTLTLIFRPNNGMATIVADFDSTPPGPCKLGQPFGALQPVPFTGFVGGRVDGRLMPDERSAHLPRRRS